MGEGGVGIPRGLRTPLLGGDGGGSGGGDGGSSTVSRSLRTFRYLCRAATYSSTLRSSSSDDSRSVSDNCRLLPVFATASAGLCRRLYSLSNSSRRTSFFGLLHHFSSRPASTDSAGARSAEREPPFWIILRFFVSDVFLTDSARRSCLLGLNLLI